MRAALIGVLFAVVTVLCLSRFIPRRTELYLRRFSTEVPDLGATSKRENVSPIARVVGRILVSTVLPGRTLSGYHARQLGLSALVFLSFILIIPWYGACVLAFLMYFFPILRAQLRERAWREQTERQIMQSVDLLLVGASAGLSLIPAMKIVDPPRGKFGRAWSVTLARIDSGTRAIDAFSEMSHSLGDVAYPLIRLLSDSLETGAPLRDALVRLRDDLSTRSRHRVQARARRAPVLMLFPLVLFILPAFVLLTIVPIVVSDLSQLSRVFR